ncbi:MAG: polysaccharide deacetylase family protein [FCB group bacterium]|nr:polysaccharide deacetylase family protein [FCB group bacterium]
MLYHHAARGLHYSGIAALARKLLARKGCFILNFHGVNREYYPNLPPLAQTGFTVAEFEAILSWLQKRFTFLTPEEALSGQRSGVLLTFDDGKQNNFTNARPLLEKYNAPAIFFISTQPVLEPDNWLHFVKTRALTGWDSLEEIPDDVAADLYRGLTAEQVRLCAEHPLITIAAHTVSHPLLTDCDDKSLAVEVNESKRILEDLGGKRVDWFAYPNGVYNRRVMEAVRSAGYKKAFAVISRRLGDEPFEITRVDISFPHPYYLDAKLCGLFLKPFTGFAEKSGL